MESKTEIRLTELVDDNPDLEELEAELRKSCEAKPNDSLWTQQFAASGKGWTSG